MAELSPQMQQPEEERIPFWRDVRVIGVLAQIAFVILVLLGARWILGNVSDNVGALGTFRCADGTESFICGFNFLPIESQFEISESVIQYDPSDSYARALMVGALNTVKVSVFGIIFATILGTVAGIARLSDNWLVNNLAKWYVDFFRNTPLLLQLFFIYFGVILLFPPIRDAIQPFGLPIFFSQRGFNLPGPVFMPSSALWLAFIILGLIQAQVVWLILGKREEQSGKASNRGWWSFLAFLVVIGLGWFVSGRTVGNQGIMVPKAARVQTLEDLGAMVEKRLSIDDLADINASLASGALTQEELDDASLKLCTVKEDPAEVNLTSQLRRAHIPYDVDRSDRIDQATSAYAEGECEILVANRTTLGAERNSLENGANHFIVPVAETPVRLSIPRIEGLNFVGGIKMTPSFAALLIGLVLFTGAYIAEIVRAGIQSVSKGQSEAAYALGLNESQRLRLVVLPQALRVIIPPLTSQYLNLAKNSSLAIAVGFADLFAVAYVTLNQTGRSIHVFIIIMVAYLTISLFISALLNWYNKRITFVER
ncbi:MAG: ABC transporter permease subunit [Candidatus Promineifilaceae bacterium]|jgi:general L-amino acid transport system permease protein